MKRIVISRKLSSKDFARRKLEQGHDVRLISFYDGDMLCSSIYADFTDETISVENHTDNFIKTAFGNNRNPTWKIFNDFLEDRCIPRARAGLREYLEAIGIDGYDPLEIIKKTAGRMAEDNQRLEIEVLKWPCN